jgi:hypothetical protein
MKPGEIIWKQIGKNTKWTVGAKHPMLTKKGIQFQIQSPKGKQLAITVELEPSDTYLVRLYEVNKKTYDIVVLKEINDVYVEDLNRIILYFVEGS